MTKIKIWFHLSENNLPYTFRFTEEELRKTINEQFNNGFCGYSYDKLKDIGSIQSIEIEEKRFNKIKEQGYFYLWLQQDLNGIKPTNIIAFSDNMSNIAKQLSEIWGKKVSTSHLETQFDFNPKIKLDLQTYSILTYKDTFKLNR